MKTFSAKTDEVRRQWYIIDARDKVLGRLASQIALRLKGKHKAEYTPHVDTGDYIVVVNASSIHVTGNKEDDKIYHWHTGYPGGIKSKNLKTMRKDSPEEILKKAVKGMMPKSKLGNKMLSKLRIYANEDHPHTAQQPTELKV